MISVEEKINRVGAISDGLIKHGIAKLKDVLGSALITTSPGTAGVTVAGGMGTPAEHLLKSGREEWPPVKEESYFKNNDFDEKDFSPTSTVNENNNIESDKSDSRSVLDSSLIDNSSKNEICKDHMMKMGTGKGISFDT